MLRNQLCPSARQLHQHRGLATDRTNKTGDTAPGALTIDGNASYDALTDGLLSICYLFGLSGSPLINGAMGVGAPRSTAPDVGNCLADIKPLLDIDGNGQADALTDGLLIIPICPGFAGKPDCWGHRTERDAHHLWRNRNAAPQSDAVDQLRGFARDY